MKFEPVAIVIPVKVAEHSLTVWTQIRESSDELNGFLEFPGGKVENSETPAQCACREFFEETGVKISIEDLALFKIYTHIYANKSLLIHAYLLQEQKEAGLKSGGWREIKSDWRSDWNGRIPAANYNMFADLVKEFLS